MYGKIFIKGIGYYFFAEILCLFLTFSLGMLGNVFFRILSAVCCLGIVICLVVNFAINCENTDRKQGNNLDKKRLIITGLAASSVYLLLFILLLVSKFGVLPDTFYRIYKLLNTPFMALCNFIASGITSSDLGVPALTCFFLFSLIPMITAVITYTMCVKNIIPEDFMYKNK